MVLSHSNTSQDDGQFFALLGFPVPIPLLGYNPRIVSTPWDLSSSPLLFILLCCLCHSLRSFALFSFGCAGFIVRSLTRLPTPPFLAPVVTGCRIQLYRRVVVHHHLDPSLVGAAPITLTTRLSLYFFLLLIFPDSLPPPDFSVTSEKSCCHQ